MFTYAAHIDKVVDGDTVDVSIDLGFHIWHKVRLRLNGLDTPEHGTIFGDSVKAFVISHLEGTDVVVTTWKPDKYGRILAEVFIKGESFNKVLLDRGYAKVYDGGKKTLWTAEELSKTI